MTAVSTVGLSASCYPVNTVKCGFSTIIRDRARLFEKAKVLPIDIDGNINRLTEILNYLYSIERV